MAKEGCACVGSTRLAVTRGALHCERGACSLVCFGQQGDACLGLTCSPLFALPGTTDAFAGWNEEDLDDVMGLLKRSEALGALRNS